MNTFSGQQLEQIPSVKPPPAGVFIKKVKALPVSPVEGEEVDLEVSTPEGPWTFWRMKYRNIIAEQPWEPIGGNEIESTVGSPVTFGLTSNAFVYQKFPGSPIGLTLPYAGYYKCQIWIENVYHMKNTGLAEQINITASFNEGGKPISTGRNPIVEVYLANGMQAAWSFWTSGLVYAATNNKRIELWAEGNSLTPELWQVSWQQLSVFPIRIGSH
jgi:hypothetical protein